MHTFRFFSALCATLMFLGVLTATAAEKTISPKKASVDDEWTLAKQSVLDVPIKNCEHRDICDLKRLLFVAEDEQLKVGQNEYWHRTQMYATYETATFETLEKYAFVQFIRGSAFSSQKNTITGNIKVTYDGVLRNFNQVLVYKIPSWIIDAKQADPTYMSVLGMPRHYWYRWQKEILPPPWISREENIYGWGRPKIPRLYIDDPPQDAFVIDGVARNVSLEFKTCLYKNADIPRATTRDNINFAEPLYCFPWRSSFVYNHDTKKFESPEGLVFLGLTGSNELVILGGKQKQSKQEEK